ncbi:MAG: hypothetical protein PHI98_03690 [Eubacteriales bacterium]|nr:hypothetical protein [Eubacteriales bacterium]
MKKNALNNERLQALFPETPQAFSDFVEHRLNDLKAGKETPVVKKKLSMGLVLALVLVLLVTAAAVAAVISPTAEFFGFLYGKEKQEALLKGDIAAIGQVRAVGDLEVTLEDVVYQSEGDMTGLYGTGIIAPKEGSKVVLIPEDYSPASPAGYTLHYGKDEEVPEDAPTYLEQAEKTGSKLLQVSVRPDSLVQADKQVDVDVGTSLLPLPDGRVRFAFELAGPGALRASEYLLKMDLVWLELDGQGEPVNGVKRDSWDVHVVPQLSETAEAAIASQTPVPEPTAAPTAAPGAVLMVGQHWSEHEKYTAAHPERSAQNIALEYGEWYDFIANPENVWDVGFFFLEDGSLDALIKAGRILDLSDNETIMAKVNDLYPRVQEALARDGKTYAVPHAVFGGHNGLAAIDEDTWKQFGWDFSKAPGTFEELAALAEEYMALPLETRRGTRFLGEGETAAATRRTLLSELVNIAYAEAMAKGDPGAIDTTAMRKGLAQIEAASRVLGGKQASRDAKGNMRVLIFEGWPYVDAHGRRQLSLHLGEVPAFTQRLGVCVINADAPNKEAAIQYVEWLVDNTNAQFLPMLNAVMTAPEIAKMSVEQNILSYNMSSLIQAGISQEDLAQVEKLKGMLASGDVSKYGPEEAGLARFRQEVAPYMTIMTSPYPVTYDIQQDYLDGKLDVDAFIKALQEAAK